jgi:hypothetical protein
MIADCKRQVAGCRYQVFSVPFERACPPFAFGNRRTGFSVGEIYYAFFVSLSLCGCYALLDFSGGRFFISLDFFGTFCIKTKST